MELGAFSISLNVSDLPASRDFYAKLGFEKIGGDEAQNWLILRNGQHVIGLFQGMFERNMLTFNPGWAQDGSELPSFTDVRDIQKALQASGLTLLTATEENSEGPGSVILNDPDGNPIMIDQHR